MLPSLITQNRSWALHAELSEKSASASNTRYCRCVVCIVNDIRGECLMDPLTSNCLRLQQCCRTSTGPHMVDPEAPQHRSAYLGDISKPAAVGCPRCDADFSYFFDWKHIPLQYVITLLWNICCCGTCTGT